MHFWQKIKKKKGQKPIIVLAPMADVTDSAFRFLIAKYGKPDVLWTEFVSADAIVMAPDNNPDDKGFTSHKKVFADLNFDKSERPIVAQLFSSNPERMEKAAKIISDLGFDGIDLNMGCPDKNIIKSGSGAGHIQNPDLAVRIIKACQKGAPDLPISIKTRIGFNKNEIETWLQKLLETKPALITLHARTKKEMSAVPADWSQIKRAVEIRNDFFEKESENQKNGANQKGGIKKAEFKTLIFGNGDVSDIETAVEKTKETGCDGVMIGRGIFGKPWLFKDLKKFKNAKNPNLKKKLSILIEHVLLYEKLVKHKNFNIMKKHFKAYVEGFDGAKELRTELMNTENAKEVKKIIKEWLKKI